MKHIPRLSAIDSTQNFLADPYGFISRKCDQLGTDIFETRLLLKKTICMKGPLAAEFFYSDAFIRHGAAPLPLLVTLFGKKGVQTLDHNQHRHRKNLFMHIMQEDSLERLTDITRRHWLLALEDWEQKNHLFLYDELQMILTKSVCEWFGVPLKDDEVAKRTHDLTAMFDSAGSKSLKHFDAVYSRQRSQLWIKSLVKALRETGGTSSPSLLEDFAFFRDLDGNELPLDVAAVEVLNVLRPTVAVSLFMVFVAHALHAHPEAAQKCLTDKGREHFVQEVRRLYPFFPTSLALVKEDVEWQGMLLTKGTRVLLDLYGTNTDRRVWAHPRRFMPERFDQWDGSPYNFIPQGGGDHYTGHRCPGEWITIRLMKLTLEILTERMDYSVPPQNLDIDMTRLPALVKSRFVLMNVKPLPLGKPSHASSQTPNTPLFR